MAALARRLAATRFPDAETVDDWSQGLPLSYAQELRRSWLEDHDWRATEAPMPLAAPVTAQTRPSRPSQ